MLSPYHAKYFAYELAKRCSLIDATDYTTANGGKVWEYILIPHNAVLANMGFGHLVSKYAYNG